MKKSFAFILSALLVWVLSIPVMAANLNGAIIELGKEGGVVEITGTSSFNIECYKNSKLTINATWEPAICNDARYAVAILDAVTKKELKYYPDLSPNTTIDELNPNIDYRVVITRVKVTKPSQAIIGSFDSFTVNPNVGGTVNYAN